MPQVPMPLDQNGAAFLQQMKEFARNFLGWIQEEGNEQEHPQGGTIDQHPADVPQGSVTPGGGAVPMPSAPNEEQQVTPPQLLRTKTTTVHDFTPGAATPGAGVPGSTVPGATTPTALASDPPVSQAQRGAMHSAAQGNSNLGIPASVGKEFANSDPGGKLPNKVADDGPAGERFALSPDGRSIVDNQGGKSYSIEEAMQILFSGGPQDASIAGQVNVTEPNTAVNTAKWSMPRIQAPGEDRQDRMGDGAGGKVLGQLLNYKANDHGSWRSPQMPAVRPAQDAFNEGSVHRDRGGKFSSKGGGGGEFRTTTTTKVHPTGHRYTQTTIKPLPDKPAISPRAEKAAKTYVDHVVKEYGAVGALARTRRMTHEPAYRSKPQWLTRAIEMLTEQSGSK